MNVMCVEKLSSGANTSLYISEPTLERSPGDVKSGVEVFIYAHSCETLDRKAQLEKDVPDHVPCTLYISWKLPFSSTRSKENRLASAVAGSGKHTRTGSSTG